jgi:hypothetical protein
MILKEAVATYLKEISTCQEEPAESVAGDS